MNRKLYLSVQDLILLGRGSMLMRDNCVVGQSPYFQCNFCISFYNIPEFIPLFYFEIVIPLSAAFVKPFPNEITQCSRITNQLG